jgi:aldose sugar dehydrogenase
MTPTELPSRAFTLDTIARDLQIPWGIARTPDGRLLVTERHGRISVIYPDGSQSFWAELDVYGEAEGIGPESGLLGIALDPDFENTGHVFVLATTWRSPETRRNSLGSRLQRRLNAAMGSSRSLPFENQVLRFTERDGVGADSVTIIKSLPTNHYHAGGGLAFGPDGMLYLSQGDAMLPALAPDARSTVGKILRYERDGSIPADNPSAESAVWATGLRNTQAFGWLRDGTLFGVDHGPSGMEQEGGRMGHDELNHLVAGANYGWPTTIGWSVVAGHQAPLWVWETAIAPAGLAVLDDSHGFPARSILVGGLRGQLEWLTVAQDGDAWRVDGRRQLINGTLGRIRSVFAAPDGAIYLTTSNRDVRGVARPGDDLLLRLRVLD